MEKEAGVNPGNDERLHVIQTTKENLPKENQPVERVFYSFAQNSRLQLTRERRGANIAEKHHGWLTDAVRLPRFFSATNALHFPRRSMQLVSLCLELLQDKAGVSE